MPLLPAELRPGVFVSVEAEEGWEVISNLDVLHVWHGDGIEVAVSPTFYEDSGTPIDPETGEDLEYIATIIRG